MSPSEYSKCHNLDAWCYGLFHHAGHPHTKKPVRSSPPPPTPAEMYWNTLSDEDRRKWRRNPAIWEHPEGCVGLAFETHNAKAKGGAT